MSYLSKRFLFSMSLLGLLGAGLVACVEDKDLQEWRRQRMTEDLGKLESAAGTYRGVLTSKASGEAIGALEISLTPQIRVVPGASGEKADGQPVLTTRLSFEDGGTRFAVTAPDGFYDPSSGRLEVSLPLLRSTGRSEQLVLSGVVTAETLAGNLEVAGATEMAARFELNRNSIEGLDQISARLEKPESRTTGEWIGTTVFRSGEARAVSGVFVEPNLTPEDQFLNRFAPIQLLQFSLNYGDSLRLVHDGSLRDLRTGKLTGRGRLPSGNGASLEVLTECLKSAGKLVCQHQTQGIGLVATTELQFQAESEARGGSPAVDDAAPRGVLTLERAGVAKLESGEVPLWLKATYAARTREEELLSLFAPRSEKTLSVSLLFSVPGESESDRLVVVFENAVLDLRTRTLDGRGQVRQMNVSFDVTLRCEGFSFPELESREVRLLTESSCRYWSSHRQSPVEIRLLPNP